MLADSRVVFLTLCQVFDPRYADSRLSKTLKPQCIDNHSGKAWFLWLALGWGQDTNYLTKRYLILYWLAKLDLKPTSWRGKGAIRYIYRLRHSAWKNSCDSLAVVGLYENRTLALRCQRRRLPPKRPVWSKKENSGCGVSYEGSVNGEQ